jgi:pimeloyl-ACP methyl ester carboxylesterase
MKYLKLVLLLMITGVTYAQPPAFSVQKCGNGKPLLMLPGFATPGAVWQETVNALPSYKFHLITYAGFGGQPAIEMPWYGKIRDELIAYIRQEDLTGISLLGHSMGGNLAVEIAAIMPERVDKVILLDALPCMRELMMPGVQAEHITYENPHNQQMLAMDEATFRQTANMMASRMTTDSLRVSQLTEWMVSADRTTFVHGYTDLLRLDLRDQLQNIQSPTLVLGASFPDKDVALSHFNNQYANLDNKKIEMAPNSRHYIMWDAPDWMYQQIVDFLQ